MNQRKLDTCTRPLFYREIPLTQGQVALVDVEDYDWLNRWKWYALWNELTGTFYARRNGPFIGSKRGPAVHMHREILGLKPGDHRRADHAETGKTLDNRRFNLRIATCSQNAINAEVRSSNLSGFKGVSFHIMTGKWQANITLNYRRQYLGLFATPEEAYAAYCAAARALHGEFARLA